MTQLRPQFHAVQSHDTNCECSCALYLILDLLWKRQDRHPLPALHSPPPPQDSQNTSLSFSAYRKLLEVIALFSELLRSPLIIYCLIHLIFYFYREITAVALFRAIYFPTLPAATIWACSGRRRSCLWCSKWSGRRSRPTYLTFPPLQPSPHLQEQICFFQRTKARYTCL